MSAANSPSHTSRGFDGTKSFYDPDFTVEISNKMRVPDKISVHSGDDHHQVRNGHHQNPREANDWMQVPDRILVAGGDKYMPGEHVVHDLLSY